MSSQLQKRDTVQYEHLCLNIIITSIQTPDCKSYTEGYALAETKVCDERGRHHQRSRLRKTLHEARVVSFSESPHLRACFDTSILMQSGNEAELIRHDPDNAPTIAHGVFQANI